MATDPINVDVDAMLNAAREFEDKHDNIRGQVTSLRASYEVTAPPVIGG